MNSGKLLIFGGTAEGRRLCENLSQLFESITVCVTTEYGRDLLCGIPQLNICTSRMNEKEMEDFIKKGNYELVIDATHPYAKEVTLNIREACESKNIKYLRLLRKEEICHSAGITLAARVKDANEAVNYLNGISGNVLLTVGSKDLKAYTRVSEFEKRLYIRVLPSDEVLRACYNLGFPKSHIIAMQGPFSAELNAAMLNSLNCKYLVTKSTGKEGGFSQKIKGAELAGAKILLIERPMEEKGFTYEEVIKEIHKTYGISILPEYEIGKEIKETEPVNKVFFPFFVSSSGKKVLVVGGGKIAERRIETLLQFSFEVTVISKELAPKLSALAESGRFQYKKGLFNEEILKGFHFVLAATGNRKTNETIGMLCKEKGIFVNVADIKEECDFYFPAIAIKDDFVVGISGEGINHRGVRDIAQKIREVLE